jgi:hypothetical protein
MDRVPLVCDIVSPSHLTPILDYETASSYPPDDAVLPEASRAAPVLCESIAAEFGIWTSPPAVEAISTANSHTRQKWVSADGKKKLITLRPGP